VLCLALGQEPAFDLRPEYRPPPSPTFDLGAKLLVGIPTGVRVQAPLTVHDNAGWVAELFVGLPLPSLPVGVAALGGRRLFPWQVTEATTFVIAPGANLGALFGAGRGVAIGGVDVDLLWVCRWPSGLEGEVGLTLGFTILALDEVSRRPIPFPVVALVAGWRF
jgi:hypothetical protein